MRWRRAGGGPASQMRTALAALTSIEGASDRLPPPRSQPMVVTDWEAVAASGEATKRAGRLPADERHLGTGPNAENRTIATESSATLVRLAKFSTDRQVRGRAFYLDLLPPLTVKFVVGSTSRQEPLRREIIARQALASARQLPVLDVLDTGHRRRYSYVVEPVLFGRHAHDSAQKQRLALGLVADLLAAHREVGVHDEAAEIHPETAARLARLVTAMPRLFRDRSHPMREAPAPAEVLAAAERLIGDPGTVPVGWCHGDLGFSNIIVDDAGAATLIDWEYAGRMPVAVDLAKLASMSPDPAGVVARVRELATPADIGESPGRRTVADQLAVMLMRELSWWESRQDKAAAAGRTAQFERGLRRRLGLFTVLAGA